MFLSRFYCAIDGMTTEWGLQKPCMEVALTLQMMMGRLRERVISDAGFLLSVLRGLRAPPTGSLSVL